MALTKGRKTFSTEVNRFAVLEGLEDGEIRKDQSDQPVNDMNDSGKVNHTDVMMAGLLALEDHEQNTISKTNEGNQETFGGTSAVIVGIPGNDT